MTMLNLADATPGYYLVRSASPTIYVLDLRAAAERLVARVRGGRPEESQDFMGDNRWWPLEQVLSGPTQDGEGAGPDDVLGNVLRVGRRHKWVWRTHGLESQYRVQRTATAIEGPLTAAGLLEQLPADRPRSLMLAPFLGREDGEAHHASIEGLEDSLRDLLEHEGWRTVDVLDSLLLDPRGAIVERSEANSASYEVTLVRWSRGVPEKGTWTGHLVREVDDAAVQVSTEAEDLDAVVELISREVAADS